MRFYTFKRQESQSVSCHLLMRKMWPCSVSLTALMDTSSPMVIHRTNHGRFSQRTRNTHTHTDAHKTHSTDQSTPCFFYPLPAEMHTIQAVNLHTECTYNVFTHTARHAFTAPEHNTRTTRCLKIHARLLYTSGTGCGNTTEALKIQDWPIFSAH